jgi:hypothetical protein
MPLGEETLLFWIFADHQFRTAAAATNRVRGPFAPNGPCFRHGRGAGRALFGFHRIAHQESPQALNTRKLLQRK